jgi:hypothetical protein
LAGCLTGRLFPSRYVVLALSKDDFIICKIIESMKKSLLEKELPDMPDALGIVTSCKEYTLAWQLDKALQARFVKQEDISIEFKKGKALQLSHLLHREPFISYRLVRNKGAETTTSLSWIIPEFKQFDYFLLIENETEEPGVPEILEKVKSCSCVQFGSIINFNEVKSKENLLF